MRSARRTGTWRELALSVHAASSARAASSSTSVPTAVMTRVIRAASLWGMDDGAKIDSLAFMSDPPCDGCKVHSASKSREICVPLGRGSPDRGGNPPRRALTR